MILRNKIDQIYASITPSPAIYKVKDSSWSNVLRLNKTGRTSAKEKSLLTPIVLSYTCEVLSADSTHHELELQRDTVFDRVIHECISSCLNFIEGHVKNKHPRQHKLFKYFNNIPSHRICENYKYEDLLYGFAEHIHSTEFTGADDPQARAVLAALQILKDKMITELNIQEPIPRKRRS